jgi:hypothetical protein
MNPRLAMFLVGVANYIYLSTSIRVFGINNVILTIFEESDLLPLDLLGASDIHGCVPSAGYIYCNYTDSCQRFNEPCLFVKVAK